MRNFWLVAKHEYRRMVMRRAFLIVTLAIPLGMAALIATAILVETSGESRLPLGYVDEAGILDDSLQAALPDENGRIKLQQFSDQAAAMLALENEAIQAFFVLPANYMETQQSDLYFLENPPSGESWRTFEEFVRHNLIHDLPSQIQHRVIGGSEYSVVDVTNGRIFSETAVINIIIPFVASFIFFLATMTGSGYMLQVITDEKENRTMEMMLTSVTPGELIIGKAIGLFGAALTQLLIYVAALLVSLFIARAYVPVLQQAVVPWGYLWMMALFFFPAYALISAIMIAIGSAFSELQQAQQVAGLLSILFILPILLVGFLFENPASPIFLFLTFFPTTSFLTISLRWGLGSIPIWHLGVSWLILVLTVVVVSWLATRIFRAGMLRYGQPMTIKTAVLALRGG